jgi:hypothetical protein
VADVAKVRADVAKVWLVVFSDQELAVLRDRRAQWKSSI